MMPATRPESIAADRRRAPSPPARRSTAVPGRTNEQWLFELTCVDCHARESATAELREFLRLGLAKAFGNSSSVTDHDLEDFAQDAVVRVLGSIESFRGNSRFTTWAMAIALRVGHTALRRRRSRHVSLEEIENVATEIGWSRPRGPLGADVRLERNDLLRALRAAIFDHLTERQRSVVLAELQGVPAARLADLMGTNRNNVYKVYFDARKKLRRTLNDQGFVDEDVVSLLEQLA